MDDVFIDVDDGRGRDGFEDAVLVDMRSRGCGVSIASQLRVVSAGDDILSGFFRSCFAKYLALHYRCNLEICKDSVIDFYITAHQGPPPSKVEERVKGESWRVSISD